MKGLTKEREEKETKIKKAREHIGQVLGSTSYYVRLFVTNLMYFEFGIC